MRYFISISLALFCFIYYLKNELLFPKNEVDFKFELSNSTFKVAKGKYVYLYKKKNKEYVDSILVSSQKNIFKVKIDSNYLTEEYSVVIDAEDYYEGKLFPSKRKLGFINPFNLNEINSSFYIEKHMNPILFHNSVKATVNGKVHISNSYINDKRIMQSISKQNDVFLKNYNLKYYDTLTIDTDRVIASNLDIIKMHAYSIHLLKILDYNKTAFKKNDFKILLNSFDKDVKKTILHKSLDRYISAENLNYDKLFPDFVNLENQNGNIQNIGNSVSKLNLVVFWAWWCGPCRAEIPEYKKLHEIYKNKGLNIIYISIDPNKLKWKEALMVEKMNWPNYIVNDNSLAEINNYFNVKAIPKSYLYDNDKQLVLSFLGYNDKNVIELKKHLKTLD